MTLFNTIRSLFAKQPVAPQAPVEAPTTPPERRRRPRSNPREGTRVLVIDDSPTIVVALKKFLRSSGCITLSAGDAETGIAIAAAEQPELIFLDIVLPGMNGFAALRALRKEPRTRDIPVVMMSGNEQAAAQFLGARINADGFMKKPFTRFDLYNHVERLLDSEHVPHRPLPAETPVSRPLEAFSVG